MTVPPLDPERVKQWEGRAAMLRALPIVCRDEILELIEDTRAVFARHRNDVDFRDIRMEYAIDAWMRRHGLTCEWLRGPIASVVNWAHVHGYNVSADSDLWQQQIWQIEEYSQLELAKLEVMEAFRRPTAPRPDALPREKSARAAHLRAWQLTSREWAVKTVPLQPIEADPTVERLDDFLARARQHFTRRAEELTRLGWPRRRKREFLDQSAEWFLRRQVKRESPKAIGTDSVSERVREFAALIEFGKLRPAKRTASARRVSLARSPRRNSRKT